MKVTKRSQLSGKVRTREIDVTPMQIKRWQEGELIQKAMPHLSDDDREFLMTGITPEEWDAMFDGASYTGEDDYE